MKKTKQVLLMLMSMLVGIGLSYALNVSQMIDNSIAYIKKIVFTTNGNDTGITKIVIDGSGGDINMSGNLQVAKNVGIGTPISSGYKFFVKGVNGNGSHTAKFQGNNGYGVAIGGVKDRYGNDSNYGSIQAYKDGVGTNENLVLQLFGGKVGIGTDNPQKKLDINGGMKAKNICLGYDCIDKWLFDSSNIKNGSITSADIGSKQVTTWNIADNAVTSSKILDGQVTTNDLANNAVTEAKLSRDVQAKLNLAGTCKWTYIKKEVNSHCDVEPNKTLHVLITPNQATTFYLDARAEDTNVRYITYDGLGNVIFDSNRNGVGNGKDKNGDINHKIFKGLIGNSLEVRVKEGGGCHGEPLGYKIEYLDKVCH